jgi:hypothetical protein
VTQSIALPKNNLGTKLPVWKQTVLKPSYQTSIGHKTSGALNGDWLFTNRKHDLVVSTSRAFGDLERGIDFPGETLASPVDVIVAHEYIGVASPADDSISNLLVWLFAFLEIRKGLISVVNVVFVQLLKLRAEDHNLILTCRGHSKVFLVWRPRST